MLLFALLGLAQVSPALAARPEVLAELRAGASRSGARQVELELDGHPLPLRLRPHAALAPGARARVVDADGEHLVRPGVQLFAWRGRDTAGSLVVRGEELSLFARDGSLGQAVIHSHPDGWLARRMALTHEPVQELLCTLPGDAVPDPEGPGALRASATPELLRADLFIEADHDYAAEFVDAQEAIDYASLLLATVGAIYRRDLGVELVVPDGYLRLWTVEPPWGVVTSQDDFAAFRDWWKGDHALTDLPRANVHLLTSPMWGGISGAVTGVCLDAFAYGISSLDQRYEAPLEHTGPGNWNVFVIVHELGHSFGSVHAGDYDPPIECVDGSGPDAGTIMSYCHQTEGGVSQVGMRFHPRVQAVIRANVDSKDCITRTPYAHGDWDADGDHDAFDLDAFDACMDQGFASIGCDEAFDLDADGDVDADDRDALELLVAAARLEPYGCANPADSLVVLGGLPAPGATLALGLDNPLGSQTPGSATFLALSLGAAPGYPCGIPLLGYGMEGESGELLLALGASFLKPLVPGASWTGPGVPAAVELPFPPDASLIGLEVHAQGLIVDPLGDVRFGLTEALRITLGE